MTGRVQTRPPPSEPATRSPAPVRAALALGLLVIVAGAVVLLSSSETRRAGTNAVRGNALLSQSSGNATRLCQGGELLPRDTGAIRLSLAAGGSGPRLTLTASAGGRVLTHGSRAAGWSGGAVTIPVQRVGRTVDQVRVCAGLGAGSPVALRGQAVPAGTNDPAAAALAGAPATGRLRIDYLRPGRESWWSYASTVAHRIGLARTRTGLWVALVASLLMLSAAGLAGWRVLRDGRDHARRELAPARMEPPSPTAPPSRHPRVPDRLRAVPTAAWACALVAFLNAAAWALIMPPFQVNDEQDHVAYVQQLAETGRLPSRPVTAPRPEGRPSREEQLALDGVRFYDLSVRSDVGAWTTLEQRRLARALAARPSRHGLARGYASLESPVYYALEAIPYRVALSGSLLDRLMLMRLLSALMAAGTALFAFLFVRELLPGTPWAWTIGGLAFALQPLFGHISGGVNPDSLLYLSSAALFYCLARGFRRGLTPRSSAAIGAVIGIGILSKLNFAGLLPGALIGVTAIAVRQAGGRRPTLHALRLPAIAIGVALAPVALMALLNVAFWDRPAIGAAAGAASIPGQASDEHGSLTGLLNYMWQTFLPPLPGARQFFPGTLPARDLWLDGFVGRFGWSQIVVHPDWVYRVALLGALAIAGLCGRALREANGALRQRLPELATYGLMAFGLAAEIGAYEYPFFLSIGFMPQARYLLPLAALLAAVFALAARGAGRRWGPAVGALIVLGALAQDLGGQLLAISKWYA